MLHKGTVVVAITAATGLALLAGCSGGTETSAAPKPAASAATQATAQGTALNLLSGTAKSNSAEPGTGDWDTAGLAANGQPSERSQRWVQLRRASAGALDPVVVNGAGLTLYRFDNDTANPSKATCNDQCAITWPPLTVKEGGRVFIAGVKRSAVGFVRRDDGRIQLTVGGWPVYRFNKDTRPGDTNGQGVGGTWFAVTPDGGKAADEDTPATEPAPAETGPAADSAILFDDAGFSDTGASQGLSGQGCQNAARAGVASSIAAQGSLKLWSEPDCKGRSLVIDGDVDDLARVDFDDAVASVFFG